MNLMRTHWVRCLVTVGLAVGLTAGFTAVGIAQSVGGEAYGAYVNTAAGSLAKSPLAVLPNITAPDGDIATASAEALSVPSTLSSAFLNSTTTGAVGTTGASAQSVATVADINILNGLITAKEVIAVATSSRTGSGASSNSNGSTFEDLVVSGVPVTSGDAALAPNTRIDLPGVGYVVLNEELRSGDGISSAGITVNMIHVVLQNAVTDLLGVVTGFQTTGEIVVGSARSAVGF